MSDGNAHNLDNLPIIGRYDMTEDFIHGGSAPPMINSPDGFDALKANA